MQIKSVKTMESLKDELDKTMRKIMEEDENTIQENIIQGIHVRKKAILLIGDQYADRYPVLKVSLIV